MTYNSNEKKTMTKACSCEDSPQNLKDQDLFLRGLKSSF